MFDRLKRLIDEIDNNVSGLEILDENTEGYIRASEEISKKLKMILLVLGLDLKKKSMLIQQVNI